MFGPVASDPTVSRPIDTLAASGEKALRAIPCRAGGSPGMRLAVSRRGSA